jgi:hypothetical protein
MGCGASRTSKPPSFQPQPASSPGKKVSSDEMAAVKAALGAAKAKQEADGSFNDEKSSFKRKFKGYKAGGGSRHNVKRAIDRSSEADAEREAIRARMAAKKKQKQESRTSMVQKVSSLKRGMTGRFSTVVSSGGRPAGLLRQMTSGLGLSRSGRSGSMLVTRFTTRLTKMASFSSKRASMPATAGAVGDDPAAVASPDPPKASMTKNRQVGFGNDADMSA